MITKELLSEVLASPTKVDYYGLSLFGYGNKNLLFKWKSSIDGTEVEDSINIYELAHKCKEWAFWNDYRIIVKMTIPDIYRSEYKINYKYEVYHTDGILDDACTWFDSEPEAIFEVCQWVLDNKGTK